MAWTYDPSLPSEKDKVRLLIGDTSVATPLYQDETIEAMLDIHGSANPTAVALCRALAAKYSRDADKWVGDLKINASQRAKAFLALAESLAKEAASRGVPSAGGILKSERDDMEANTDRISPFFRRDQFRYRGDD